MKTKHAVFSGEFKSSPNKLDLCRIFLVVLKGMLMILNRIEHRIGTVTKYMLLLLEALMFIEFR